MDYPDLCLVYDFGLHPDQLTAMNMIEPLTVAQIAGMLIDEADLARLGRWRGAKQPSRWAPGQLKLPNRTTEHSHRIDAVKK